MSAPGEGDWLCMHSQGCGYHFRQRESYFVSSGAPPLPGLPDAPLDVQAEPGPSPGILMISWLPVTIDAAGTSNGVRVTGYAIYADGQKVWLGDSS